MHNSTVQFRVALFIRFYNALRVSGDPEHRQAAKSFKRFYTISCIYAIVAAIIIMACAVLFGDKFDTVFFALGCAVFIVISSCVVSAILTETVGKEFFKTLKKYSCRKCGSPNMELSPEWTCGRCEKVNTITDPPKKRGVLKTTLQGIAVAAILIGGSFLIANQIPDRDLYDVHVDKVEMPAEKTVEDPAESAPEESDANNVKY